MNVKLVKTLAPPFLVNFFLRLKDFLGFYEWKYVAEDWHPSFDYHDSWNLKSISDLQLEKWKNYSEEIKSNGPLGINHEASIPYDNTNVIFHNLLITFAYVSSLASQQKREIKFLDWGGGIGHYGLLIKNAVPDIVVNYFCYDLDIYCDVGRTLWKDSSVFSSNREELLINNKYDLVMASSSIWYEPNWKEMMKRLIDSSKEYIFITRMLFVTKKNSYVAIQRPKSMGYNTEYYFWVINENEFLTVAHEKGLTLIREFIITDQTYIYRAPEQGKFKGFLFRKTVSTNDSSDII